MTEHEKAAVTEWFTPERKAPPCFVRVVTPIGLVPLMQGSGPVTTWPIGTTAQISELTLGDLERALAS